MIDIFDAVYYLQSSFADLQKTASLLCDEAFWPSEDEDDDDNQQNFTIFKDLTKRWIFIQQ
jgi:hypothetical protein